MLGKIEHVGIAVKDVDAANLIYEKLLGTAPYKQETVKEQNVTTSFFKAGENKIELVAAMDSSSPVAKFIDKRGEGVHHIAFAVDDILAEMNRLEKEGFTIIDKTPKKGADNKLVAFLHPKGTSGVLVELCQEIKE